MTLWHIKVPCHPSAAGSTDDVVVGVLDLVIGTNVGHRGRRHAVAFSLVASPVNSTPNLRALRCIVSIAT